MNGRSYYKHSKQFLYTVWFGCHFGCGASLYYLEIMDTNESLARQINRDSHQSNGTGNGKRTPEGFERVNKKWLGNRLRRLVNLPIVLYFKFFKNKWISYQQSQILLDDMFQDHEEFVGELQEALKVINERNRYNP